MLDNREKTVYCFPIFVMSILEVKNSPSWDTALKLVVNHSKNCVQKLFAAVLQLCAAVLQKQDRQLTKLLGFCPCICIETYHFLIKLLVSLTFDMMRLALLFFLNRNTMNCLSSISSSI